jgi:orotidine-5'-phosphate decarboxylase
MAMTKTETFRERLNTATAANDSLLCVGLDPDPARLPADAWDAEDVTGAIVDFNAGIIAATADLVCAYKPNLAFYLAHGAAGIAALLATRRLVPSHIPVILDAKFGDIGNTAAGYAQAAFDALACDAVTVNPYLGEDALEPFLRRAGAGVIVLCKTSNPGSGDLQDLQVGPDGPPLYLSVASRVAAWNERWPANLGLVVGATFPGELAAVRRHCPDLPILLPGVGAQEGDMAAAVRAGLDARGMGLIVSASRAVLYPPQGGKGAARNDAVRAAAQALREGINAVRP